MVQDVVVYVARSRNIWGFRRRPLELVVTFEETRSGEPRVVGDTLERFPEGEGGLALNELECQTLYLSHSSR